MIINHGVRGSVPNPSEKNMIFGGNTPCVEIKTNKYQLIFDCGTGFSKVDFSNNLQSIIFISHFHHDHIQGFAFNGFSSDLNKKIIHIDTTHEPTTDLIDKLISKLNLKTDSGIITCERNEEGIVSINMGLPKFLWSEIPLAVECETLHLPLEGDPVATNVGNPHCTFFVDDIEKFDIECTAGMYNRQIF